MVTHLCMIDTPMGDDRDDLIATPSQTVGPFFHVGLTGETSLGCLVHADTKGVRIRLRVRVLDGNGLPVPDALVELWHADAGGVYVRPDEPASLMSPAGFCGFGRLGTDADGACLFETIHPGRVPDGRGGLQASHINVCLFARGLLRQVFTRVYFAGDEGHDADPVLTLVPADRRETLLARSDASAEAHDGAEPARWSIEIHLQGERETVFFDL